MYVKRVCRNVGAHLPALVTIISVPSWLNSSHKAFISSCTLMLATLGFFLTIFLLFGVELDDDEEQLGVPLSLGGAWPGLDPG